VDGRVKPGHDGDLPSGRRSRREDFEMHAGLFLQHPDDIGQVGCGRIAVRPEHAHQALDGSTGGRRQLRKANGRVDVGAQRRARRVDAAASRISALVGNFYRRRSRHPRLRAN